MARYKGVSPRLENVLKILDNCRKFLFCTSTRFSTNNFKLFAYTMPCGRVAQPLLRVFTRNLSLKRTRLLVPRWTLGERNVLHHITGFSQSFSSQPSKNAETIKVVFRSENEEDKVVDAPIGENILEVAHANDVDLEGACECSLACSTCHVILDEEYYNKLPEATDEENDMLDLAFGLTETSRLGCQIICSKELDGMVCRIPAATRNMAVDGYKPKHH